MDWMTFVVELVKALAWPAVVAMAILVFKKRLLTLVDELTELKGLGMEARFAREAKHVRKEVDAIPAQAPATPATSLGSAVETLGGPAPSHGEVDDDVNPATDVNAFLIHDLLPAALDSTMSIIRARQNLEKAIASLADHNGLKVMDGVEARMLLRRLAMSGQLSNAACMTGIHLLELGSEVSHAQLNPDIRATLNYVQAVNSFVRLLFGVKQDD
jgi:hypothetical protein